MSGQTIPRSEAAGVSATDAAHREDAPDEAPPAPIENILHVAETIRERTDILRDDVQERVTRQTERVQHAAHEVQSQAQQRAQTIQESARNLRTQIGFRQERSHPFRYAFSIVTAKLLSWFAWLLPPLLRVGLANGVGWLVYERNRGYRENLHANLRVVLGGDASEDEIERTARVAFKISISNFLDLVLTPRTSLASFKRRVSVTPGSWERLAALRDEGKGVILVSGHLGAFDAVGQAFIAWGYPMTVVTGRTTFRFIFDGVSYLRGSKGVSVVEPSPTGVRQVFRRLRANELVAFVADRDFFFNGRPVTFFGKETTLPPGPVRIARDTGAPILPAFTRRTRDGYVLWFGEPFRVERTKDAERDLDAAMTKLVRELEAAISAQPEQWVMFQRVWPEG